MTRVDSSSDKFRCLSVDEAKVFHQRMTISAAPLTFLGQPVKLSDLVVDDKITTIVRIAFGADLLVKLFAGCSITHETNQLNIADCSRIFANLEAILEEDRRIVKKMVDVAKAMDMYSFNEAAKE